MAYADTLYKRYFLEYASYVIKDRAIPEIDDGLKPVQRRILHTLFDIDDGKYHKVANVVGQTMRFHPHGDQSIFGALVTLANKDLFIDKQGNFGSVFTGDEASAARYIECRLMPLAKETLHNPEITEYIESYDGRNKEPVAFPAKVPVLLALGAEGIAVGMSTRILPHNFIELMKAQIACLKGKRFRIRPDFPTGGLVDVTDYKNGNGKVLVRARIDTSDPRRIIIRELPYGSTTDSLIASIEEAARNKKIKISGIADYTAEQVEIEIRLTRGVKAEDTIDALYAFTDCESSLSTNLLVIDDERPRNLTVTQVIRHATDRLLEVLAAELRIEANHLRQRLRNGILEQIFIEHRIYKQIEEIDDTVEINEAIRRGFRPFTAGLDEAADLAFDMVLDGPAQYAGALRDLLTTLLHGIESPNPPPVNGSTDLALNTFLDGHPHYVRAVREILASVRRNLTPGDPPPTVELSDEDIDTLLKIPIRRISLYNINRAREEMEEIRVRLHEIRAHLDDLKPYAITFLENLVEKYKDQYPRRTEIKSFNQVNVLEAAPRNLALKYNRKTGYLGYDIDGEPLFDVSTYDRIVVIRKSGVYALHDDLEKLFVDKGMLYCGFLDPDLEFTIVYRNRKRQTFLKRFTLLKKPVLNRDYELVPEGCRVLGLSAESAPEITIYHRPEETTDPVPESFSVSDYPVQNSRGKGILLPVERVDQVVFMDREPVAEGA